MEGYFVNFVNFDNIWTVSIAPRDLSFWKILVVVIAVVVFEGFLASDFERYICFSHLWPKS